MKRVGVSSDGVRGARAQHPTLTESQAVSRSPRPEALRDSAEPKVPPSRLQRPPAPEGVLEGRPDWVARADPAQADPALIATIVRTDPQRLALDVATTSLRLRERAAGEDAGAQVALRGCDAMDRQALLFEHLHILCTEAPELFR